MIKCIVKEPVAVFRDGKQVLPAVGREFDFTEKEVFEIGKLNSTALEEVAAPTVVEMPTAKTAKGN